ncbi:MAG: ABC transporter ATP-binding protein [Deltaproteobacteria bacterium]|jgi:putative ABC transport system ATP-binding protein|nr:ABC transporter ATP-binding protein [Deltaproteobacteria bacterium]MCL5880719.1 ABC transporter ATP-binding protein [Deltaproteobacteria bacterium]MDA8304196.1 ABC transporter ATP-binding protein [Deltaproteobacteria bacterium]
MNGKVIKERVKDYEGYAIPDGNTPLIKLEDIGMTYKIGDVSYEVLRKVNLSVNKGEFLSIMGASGSGKSTLMNIMGCLDRPTAGRYFLEGRDVSNLTSDELAEIRNKKIGFVFQGFNLIQRLSIVENVELPLYYSGMPSKEATEMAMDALKLVDLSDKGNKFPNQISGGEQQRVAIARAIVNNAPIIMADEPTGNLDSIRGAEVMKFFKKINEERGVTIILVSHDKNIANYGKRLITVKDGIITSSAIIEAKSMI